MATLTRDEYLAQARPLNPDYTDEEILREYERRYGDKPVTPSGLPTFERFLPLARAANPDYSDEEHRAYWEDQYGSKGASETTPHGVIDTLREGAKSTGRSLKAAGQVYFGSDEGLVETAKAQQAAPRDPALDAILQDIAQRKAALGNDPGWIESGGALSKAAIQNPKGAGLLLVEQIPNSIAAMGSAGVGALAGSGFGPGGAIVGGLAGLFLGNTAIETGGKALEAAADETVTPDERDRVRREGAIKGGVVTALDAATLAVTNWLTGTTRRAVERATVKTLTDHGVNVADHAAVTAARTNPLIVQSVKEAADRAKSAVNTLGRRLGRGAGAVASESIGEGAGEYLGEYAATGHGDKVEALVEAYAGLGQSAAEIAATHLYNKTRLERIPERLGLSNPGVSLDQVIQESQAILEETKRLQDVELERSAERARIKETDELSIADTQAQRLARDQANLQRDESAINQASQRQAFESTRIADELAEQDAAAKQAILDQDLARRAQSEYATLPSPERTRGPIQPALIAGSPSPIESPVIEPGQAFTPRQEPALSPQDALEQERARLVQMQEENRQRLDRARDLARTTPQGTDWASLATGQAAETPQPAPPPMQDTLIPSQAQVAVERAYPSVEALHRLAESKGLAWDSNPVFMELTRMVTGKAHLDALTPQERELFAKTLQKITPSRPTAPAMESSSAATRSPEGQTQTRGIETAPTPIDASAHVAATSPKNDLPQPTDGQKEAGNYQKGHIRIAGMDISVENPAGSERSGRGEDGKPWSVTLEDHYGYIRGTKGRDKDHIDIFIKPGIPESYNGLMFVVDQKNKDGDFDEHKVIMGASSVDDARQLYQRNYSTDRDGIMSIKQFTMPEFKLWLKAGNKSKPVGAPSKVATSQNHPVLGQEVSKEQAITQPRSSLPVEHSMEMLLRAEKGLADLEIAGTERGGRFFQEQQGQGSTQEVVGLKSPTAQWYKDLTTGPRPLKRHQIDTAIRKIIQDQGVDTGKAVEQVKAALLQDREFDKTPWGEDADAIMRGEWPSWIERPEDVKERKSPISVPSNQDDSFTLTSKESTKPKAQSKKLEQLAIEVPTENIGSRPIIGREAQPEEAPLFSKSAQEKDTEQTVIPSIAPAPSDSAQSPTEILASALRSAADRIEGKTTTPSTTTVEQAPSPDALAVVDRMYRDILDDTKAVFHMKRDQKEAWQTIRRVDTAMKEQLKAGLDYDEAVKHISIQDIAAVSDILKNQNQAQAEKSKAEELDTQDTDQGIALFDERDGPVGPPTMAQFEQAWKTGATIEGTGKKVVDSSQQYPADLLTDLAKKPYVKKLTRSLSLVFREMSGLLHAQDSDFGAPSFVGLSPDDYYVGVNLRGPDAVILNPWGAMWRAEQHIQHNQLSNADANEYLSSFLLKTMVHELTHQQIEGHDATFDDRLEANYAIIGLKRFAAWQRLLMGTLQGETDALSQDLRTQQAFWSQRDRLSDESRGRDAESGPIFDREDVAGEGTAGRTGPPTNLRGGSQRETATLDRRPAFQRRGAVTPDASPDYDPLGLAVKPMTYEIPALTKMDGVIRTLQDKNIDLVRVVEEIKKSHGDLADDLNPVLKEELYMGRLAHRNQEFLTDELRPLIDAMRLQKVSIKELDTYLHARHAQEANAYLKSINPDREDNDALSGMTDQEAQAILSKASPAMQKLGARVDSIVAKTRQLMVDYGLESPERIASWEAQYSAYVPLYREGFEERMGTGQGRSIRGSTVKSRTGSTRSVINILGHLALDREKILTRGEKMRPVLALAGLLKQYPNAELAKLATPTTITYHNPDTGLEETLPGQIGEYNVPTISVVVERRNEAGELVRQVEHRPDPSYKGRDNVVNFRIAGKDHALIFNEQNERAMEIAKALKDLNVGQLNTVLQAVAPVTRYLAAVNTQYNPVFGIVNFVRDVQFAMLSLQSTPLKDRRSEVLKNTKQTMFGIYKDARAIRHGKHLTSSAAQLWERFQKVGGPTGYRDIFKTSEDRVKAIQHLLDPDWWQKTTAGKILTVGGTLAKVESAMLNKIGKTIFEWLSDYNQTMENAIRLGVFKTAIDAGMTDEQGASLAKNITVNFNKKGQIGAQMGAAYAFFNANVQGTARLAETLFEPGKIGVLSAVGKRIVAGGVTLGVLQAVGLALSGFDEDDPPEWLKARSFVIPAPGTDKGYVSVPMPLGFNLLPNVGRLMAESLIYGRPTDKGYKMLTGMIDVFSPLGSTSTPIQVLAPTVADPIVALAENKDWTGRPIYREDFNRLHPTPGHTRAKDSSTPWARGLAEAINYATLGTEYVPGKFSPTPDQIDYLIEQATGGVGREIAKTVQSVSGAVTGEDVPLYKIPLAGRFVGSASGTSATRDRFYRNLEAINLAESEMKGRLSEGENVAEYVREHPEARLAQLSDHTHQVIQKLNKQKREIKQRGGDTREQVRLIDMRIQALMQQLNQRMETVGAR